MAKYEVKMNCGHIEEVELFGKDSERKNRIDYLQAKGLCKKCYAEKQAKEMGEKFDEVVMSYVDYKNNYSNNKTKKDSYNAKDKTIVVYVEKAVEAVNEDVAIVRYVNSKKEVSVQGNPLKVLNDMVSVADEKRVKVIELMDKKEGEDWKVEVCDNSGKVVGYFNAELLAQGKSAN